MTEKFPLYLAKPFRYVKWALLILVLAYFAQFLWAASHKGQSKMGAAFETIAQEALYKHYDGLPQMQLSYANMGPNTSCSFGTFEWIWGDCATVVLYVRDYRPEQRSIVEREVLHLADSLRKPCLLLPTLGLPNEQQLGLDLQCDGISKSFKLRIRVESVIVDTSRRSSHDPSRWLVKSRETLNDYYL